MHQNSPHQRYRTGGGLSAFGHLLCHLPSAAQSSLIDSSTFDYCYITNTTIPFCPQNLYFFSLKMNAESSNEGSQSGGSSAMGGGDGGGSQNSNAAAGASYSGVVAQRALYGSYKRRVGRRMVSKSAPSRLSKVSAAGGNDT